LIKLRPYQQQIAQAIIDSIQVSKGLTFSVEIARQGGKNELSAILETILLTLYINYGGNIVKASPTFKPQTMISMERLKQRLDDYSYSGIWRSESGYIISLGSARAIFLSADGTSNVVGHTADILLEIDESQDVSQDKYTKEFRPMASAYNTTTVHYGTTWDDSTLLEQLKQTNLELERKDGIKRHFRYDWQEIAKFNPNYAKFVLEERERLGENHPLFLTQYALLPIHGGGRLLTIQQRAQLLGNHQRAHQRQSGKFYIAGIDLAGEQAEDSLHIYHTRDSTVITIAEVSHSGVGFALEGSSPKGCPMSGNLPVIKIFEHYSWTGIKHPELYPQMVDILKNVWNCSCIVVDATGIGEPTASFLKKELGPRVKPFKFTQQSKSELGFELLSTINAGRLKIYRQDNSPEYQELMSQLEKAKVQYRPNQTMNFYVDPADGHDDFLMSLVLTVAAAKDYQPRVAKGALR
jgi:hypothetical protein